jgi:hypothetical protein
MTTNNKKQDYKKETGGKRFIPTPIPLVTPDIPPLKKNKRLVVKLPSKPTEDHSQTYKLTIK